MKVMLAFFALWMATTLSAFAQPDSVWSRFYGGTNNEYFASVQQDEENFIFAGTTYSFGEGNSDMWLVKTEADGDTVWTRTFGGAFGDNGSQAGKTQDGGYYIAGCTNSYGNGAMDFWLVKTNDAGEESWNRTYGGSNTENLYCAQETSDGGFILAGESDSFGGAGYDFWIVKTNSSGDSVWSYTFGGAADAGATYIVQTSDGGYAVCGVRRPPGSSLGDFRLIKLDQAGNPMWSQTYGNAWDDVPWCVREIEGGGFVLAGQSGRSNGFIDLLIIKTNEFGDSLSSLIFGNANTNEVGYSVLQTADGGFACAGRSSKHSGSMLLLKCDVNGSLMWTSELGGAADEISYGFVQLGDGSFAVAGGSVSFGVGGADAWLLKTGTDPTAVDDYTIMLPQLFALSCYPNPFNPSTTIVYDLPQAGRISLSVFDPLGREVAMLENGMMEAGTHCLTFDGSNLASGIYFARLDAGSFSQTKKLMLLK